MTRDIRLFVEDILESIAKIENYIGTMNQAEFSRNSQVQDAVMRRLEIIGEAVKNLPEDFRLKYSVETDSRFTGCLDPWLFRS